MYNVISLCLQPDKLVSAFNGLPIPVVEHTVLEYQHSDRHVYQGWNRVRLNRQVYHHCRGDKIQSELNCCCVQ